MSYILDALRKAERERGIAQVPTLMTVHENQPEIRHNRLWVIAGISLVCTAAAIWFAVALLKPTGVPSPSGSAVTSGVRPEAVSESSPEETVSALPSGTVMSAETRSPFKSQAISGNVPRVVGFQTDQQQRKRMGDENATTIPKEIEPLPIVPEPAKNAVQRQTVPGAGGPAASPAKSGSSAATDETTTADSSQPKLMSLREAMSKMKITILVYDEARSERMVFINDRKYVEGDFVDGRYFLESITADGVVLSFQGERTLLRASR